MDREDLRNDCERRSHIDIDSTTLMSTAQLTAEDRHEHVKNSGKLSTWHNKLIRLTLRNAWQLETLELATVEAIRSINQTTQNIQVATFNYLIW